MCFRNVGKQVAPLSEDLFQPAGDNEEGIGPMRVWPCGLAVSRSVGDYDCGCEVTAAPFVRQVRLIVFQPIIQVFLVGMLEYIEQTLWVFFVLFKSHSSIGFKSPHSPLNQEITGIGVQIPLPMT